MKLRRITPERVVGKFSLTGQSFFLYILLPFFSYLLFLVVSGSYFMKAQNQPVSERCIVTSEFVGERTDRFIGERMNEILNLSSSNLPLDIINGISDKRDWHTKTRSILRTSIQYDELIICDTLGNTIVSNKTDHRGNAFPEEYTRANHFGEEWFRDCLASGGHVGGAYVSDINYSDYNIRYADWGIDLATPLKSATGKLMGVLKLRLNWPASAASLLPGKDDGQTILMFTKQGNLIAANVPVSELKLGKNKMQKAPDFAMNGKAFSDEYYHYSWTQSMGADIFRGNGWFILVLAPQYLWKDLLHNNDFMWGVVIPGAVIFLLILVSWNIWNRKLRRQLREIGDSLTLLNAGRKVQSTLGGSLEMRKIEQALNELSLFHEGLENFMDAAIRFETAELTSRSPSDKISASLRSLGSAHIQMRDLDLQNHYIAKGIQEITNILYTNKREQALRKFCSYLHHYLHVMAIACFFPSRNILVLEASWGLVESDIVPEQYNLLFECRDSKKTIEFFDRKGTYLNVKSGLGNATGLHVYIIPMIFAQRCDGVFEIASVKPLSGDALKFLNQAGSMLAVYKQYLIQEIDKPADYADVQDVY